MHALTRLVREAFSFGGCVELYPVADGNEGRAPKGRVEMSLGQFGPEQTVFTEQFFYVVRDQGV
jgi:hypothetical protein